MNSYLIKFSSPLTAEQVEGILAEWGRVEVNEAPEAVKVRTCKLENVVRVRYGKVNLF